MFVTEHRPLDLPLCFEELQEVRVGAEVLGHGARHLVVVHLLRQLESEAGVIGYGFITESHFNSKEQVPEKNTQNARNVIVS